LTGFGYSKGEKYS